MSIANPLTASSAIQRAFIQKSDELSKDNPLKPNLDVYAKDVIEISKLGLEKQQKDVQVEASRNIEGTANEVIRVSSTIGKAKAVDNLTHNQATNLYNKVSGLL
jgi:hypothetical protein